MKSAKKIRNKTDSMELPVSGKDPKLGRVKRLRGPKYPISKLWSRSDARNWPGEAAIMYARKRAKLVMSLVLSLAALLVIGGLMIFWLRAHGLLKSAASVPASTVRNVRIASRFTSPTENEALDLVKRALANRDPQRAAGLLRLGNTSATEAIDFLKESIVRDGRIKHYKWLSSMDLDDMLMEGVLVIYDGNLCPGGRLAFLTPDDKGVWKVDFEAFARSSHPSWQELLEQRSDHALVRVFVVQEAYYNGPFKDDSQWRCFGMISPEAKERLPEGLELMRGYCKGGSSQAMAMERIFKSGRRAYRASLEIRRVAGADARQFEITRVLSKDWVLPDKPFDERFNDGNSLVKANGKNKTDRVQP